MQKWTVEISVDDSWISDLYGAFDDEVKVTIVGSPALAELIKLRKGEEEDE